MLEALLSYTLVVTNSLAILVILSLDISEKKNFKNILGERKNEEIYLLSHGHTNAKEMHTHKKNTE